MKRCVENIDLSQRLKGATHFFWERDEEYPDYNDVCCWEKWDSDGNIYEWEDGSWVYLSQASELRDDQLVDRVELPPEMKEPVYWDGESDIKVGMVLTTDHNTDLEYKVKHIQGFQVVVENTNTGLLIVDMSDIKPVSKSEYEEYKKKVLDKWQKQGLDYAYDELTDEQEKIVEICFEIEQGED